MKFSEMNLKDNEKIIKLWNDNIGAVYPLEDRLFLQNYGIDKQNKKILGAFDEKNLAGFVIYKQWGSPSGLLNPNPAIGYINSIIVDMKYRNSGIGTALLDSAEKDLNEKGVKLIHAGSDTNHFFPGIPSECINGEKFFSKRGYEIEETFYDLICDISKVELERLPNIRLNQESRYKTEILDKNDRNKLFTFFKKNFSGRWYQEIMDFFEIGMEDRDVVVLKNEDKIIGFAHIYDNKSNFIGPSIYWKKLLCDNYGGLGPIGIDEDYRKLGLGLLILYKSLEILKQRNVNKMVIDWTDKNILDFYGMFNFMPWKEYRKATKRI
ncbi:MAG: acetyltransferase [Clostridiaceae bacterium]|nr:acetyltransferase [Clostridiaceae bacterium]